MHLAPAGAQSLILSATCVAEQMPNLRPGGSGSGSHRLGSIKELDSGGSAAAAADGGFSAEKLALRRLIMPGARDSADGDPESVVTVSSPAGEVLGSG